MLFRHFHGVTSDAHFKNVALTEIFLQCMVCSYSTLPRPDSSMDGMCGGINLECSSLLVSPAELGVTMNID